MICLGVNTYIRLMVPLFTREIIDHVLVEGLYDRLVFLSLAIVGATALRGLISFGQRYSLQYVGQKIVFDFRKAVYDSLLEKSFSFYDKTQTGQLMTRVTGDVDQIRRLFTFGTERILDLFFVFTGVFFIIGDMDWKLTLVSLLPLPVIIVLARFFAKQIRPIYRKVRQSFGDLNVALQENILATKLVRVFAREDFEKNKFDSQNTNYMNINLKAAKIRSNYRPLMALLLSLSTALIYWYGGGSVIGGTLTLGSLIVFGAYSRMLMEPIRFIGMFISMIQNAIAGGERIFEIIDEKPEIQEVPNAVELPPIKGTVRFEKVTFGYDKETPILKNITLTVQPNETIALIGATGSGKSTFINLITRFYDVSSGKISIDGCDIREVTLNSLRKQIGIVPQETFLFSGSIKDNIRFGKPHASMDEIVNAAKLAQAHAFIMSFPEGYDTRVGERGVTLSGGQKQRVAIARALLIDPRILILDDSTSSVDITTEHEIQQALKTLFKDRTTFVITQRLSTIKHADKIVVMDNGEIIQIGTHRQLLAESGVYSRLYLTQFASQEQIPLQEVSKKPHGG
jgi:ATP-binding cassette subfamily B protein